ncbi:PDZ domain-containing protein [Paenibacillus rhizoplanae]
MASAAGRGGLGLVSLPVIIGFSEMTQGMLPGRKAARTFGRLLVYSAVLLGLSLLADLWSPLTVVAALAALLLHEGLSWYSALEERSLSPVFVHPPAGRKVLAVLQGSPAQELGILPGEILLKVNGVLLTSAAQLHEALRMNSAFCKLEVQNREGESKYLQRALYAGDHHQLGIILVPDPDGGHHRRGEAVQHLQHHRDADRHPAAGSAGGSAGPGEEDAASRGQAGICRRLTVDYQRSGFPQRLLARKVKEVRSF